MRLRRRGKGDSDGSGAAELQADGADGDAPAGDAPAGASAADVEVDRSAGPFDIEEVEERDALLAQRLDLGAVQLPLLDGMEVRVEVDQANGQPVAITVIRGEGAVQLRAFAAPRSGGGWDEARRDIRREITSGGGTVDEVPGPFGVELFTMGIVTDEQGRQHTQRMRFVGVDGPRWMLQGVLFGAGAVSDTAGALDEVLRAIVVSRGDAAMPPGTMLELTLPAQVPGADGPEDVAFEEDEDELDEDELDEDDVFLKIDPRG